MFEISHSITFRIHSRILHVVSVMLRLPPEFFVRNDNILTAMWNAETNHGKTPADILKEALGDIRVERTLGGSMNSSGINSGRGFSSNFGRISDRNSGINYTKNPKSTFEENLARTSCRKPEKNP